MISSNNTQSTAQFGMSATDQAISTVCAKHLHQSVLIPGTQSHATLRCTFSTTGNFENKELPAMLFCPPMFGGRWIALEFERLAALHGVRVICPDRPGMGGSTRVTLDIRVKTWLETTKALLDYLGVQHVSIFAHSAGTMYAFNTVYHLREILDPERPFMVIIAPWVSNAYSHATLMNVAAAVPDKLIDSWNGLNQFINTRIAPVASWSGGIFSSVGSMLGSGSDGSDPSSPGECYGTTEEVGKEIERLRIKCLFAEDTTAGNEEARLCLRKGGSGPWGVCEDFEDFVRSLSQQERDRRQSNDASAKLTVRAYYAESDIMIGKQGQQYFERCWRQDIVDEYVGFESRELPKTNHDSALLDPKNGALKLVFEEIAKRA